MNATAADNTVDAPAPPRPLAPPAGLAETLEELDRRPRVSWLPLLLLSLAAYILGEGAGASAVQQTTVLVAVLLVHELGHLAAMRLLGWQDVRIFFVPFVGALTTGRAARVSRVREAVVLLAGPVPGIALAGAILLTRLREHPLAWDVGITAVAVNAFNLLPLGFLDGGRLLDRLVFQRHRVLETAFAALSSAAFFAGGTATGDWIFLLLASVSLMGVPVAWRRGREAARLRDALDPGADRVRALPEPQLHALYEAAVAAAGPRSRPTARAGMMRDLFERATTPHASALACAGFGFTWLAAIVGSILVFGVGFDEGPARWSTVSHEAGFAAEFPSPTSRLEGTQTIQTRHGGGRFEVFSEEVAPDDLGGGGRLPRYARRVVAELEGEVVEEGLSPRDPSCWRVRVRGPFQVARTLEFHDAGSRIDTFSVSYKTRRVPRVAETERFFASYARQR
jgi:Zn-dependent protease